MTDSTQWVGDISPEQLDLLIRRLQPKQTRARIAPRQRPGEPAPLSFGQEQLWFLEQMDPGAAVYHLPAAIRCEGELRIEVLARALAEIVRRHEALRTRFTLADGRPVQSPAPPPEADRLLPVRDLAALPAEAQEAEAGRLAAEEARRPFDLTAGRLLRAALLRRGPRRHLLLLTVHHLGADAWSVGLLLGELAALYAAFAAGLPSPLPEPAVQYADFAGWQREALQGETLERLLAHWRERLGDRPAAFELPPDHPRPAVQAHRGARVPVAVPPAAAAALRRLGREAGASPFASWLAVLAALLARWTGHGDVVVGTAAANRPEVAVEKLIGLFINTVVLRADLAGDPTFRAVLERCRETALAAFSHAELPFQRLVEHLRPERDPSRGPLFQIFFTVQEGGLPALELDGLTMRPEPAYAGGAEFDLAVALTAREDGVDGWIDYDADLYEEATVRRLADRLAAFAEAAAAAPDRRISELPLLSPADEALVLGAWAGTGELGRPRRSPCPSCSPRGWRALRTRSPPSIATGRSPTGSWRRGPPAWPGACARWAWGPATGWGSAPSARCRCSWRCSPCWRPAPPTCRSTPPTPQARLAGMLADAGVAALIAHGERAAARLPGRGERPRRRRRRGGRGRRRGGARAAAFPPPESLAYVIYTSGSTGGPRG